MVSIDMTWEIIVGIFVYTFIISYVSYNIGHVKGHKKGVDFSRSLYKDKN